MRTTAAALGFALLVTSVRLAEGAPADPLVACQRALGGAGRTLGDHLRHEIGACLRLGVACLTADAADLDACCDTAAARCRAHARKIAKAKRRYLARLRAGRCARVRFDLLTAADGLGFAKAVQTCGCLEPTSDVDDLASLAACVARLSEVETTRLLATTEAPRAAEALTCVDRERELAALERSVVCAQASPTPDVAPTATSTPPATRPATATATPSPLPTRTAASTPPLATRTATATPDRTATPTVTSARTTTPTPLPTRTPVAICGNGVVEGDEECDGSAFDTTACVEDVCTCEDFCDDAGGRFACRLNCTIDFSRCTAGGCEF